MAEVDGNASQGNDATYRADILFQVPLQRNECREFTEIIIGGREKLCFVPTIVLPGKFAGDQTPCTPKINTHGGAAMDAGKPGMSPVSHNFDDAKQPSDRFASASSKYFQELEQLAGSNASSSSRCGDRKGSENCKDQNAI
ncbi:hypothetical protein PLEOSDRAFT_1099977 [Pleurotus ostreatus PC15]|uniref:Uncharacterized protein n=1 Tax=Pleurotus ostreatus (strain PC15) TaxID=1137138 RepID=A0A067PDR8_PLEO1|nr:hypothetical protein PLEOSDRAFT_1099977 [Pleurotus ostreatus PC15]